MRRSTNDQNSSRVAEQTLPSIARPDSLAFGLAMARTDTGQRSDAKDVPQNQNAMTSNSVLINGT
jgi:hypothetical protein